MKPILIFIIFATLLAVGSINTSMAQTPEQLYQKGLGKEEGEGALQDAINLYNQVTDNTNASISLRAKALLHIGMCFEKLGTKEAVKAYQRLVANFPTQKNEVAYARERLTRLAPIAEKVSETPLTPKFTKIIIPTNPGNGVLEPDGNKLAFISEDAVWIIPLHGKINSDIAGEPVQLARIPGIWDNGSLMAWSADGKWIAVNGKANGKNAAYVIPVNGGEPRVVPMPDRGSHAWSARLSLSPDGQTLAFSAVDIDIQQEASDVCDRRIYTIPVAGGKPKQVSSGWAMLPSFSFNGKFISYVGYSERDDWRKDSVRSHYNGDLWVVHSAGETPLKLTTVDGRLRGPLWSPDGKYIAAHLEPGGTNASREIWVYPLSTDASRVGEPGKISLPQSSWNMLAGWTPNNELGVFFKSEEHEAIYTVPASGGMAVQITPVGLSPNYPRWSKNGEDRIYFRGFDEDGDKVTTHYVPDNGGSPVELPVRSERRLVSIWPGGGLNISPNGKMIVISAYQEPYDPKEGVDLWTIPFDRGSPTRLTNDEFSEKYPCWSPDGRSIAFTRWQEKSKDEGFDAIYMMPSEGGEIRQISSETDSVGDGAITYSPDGLRIAFFSGGAIKAISVESGQTEVLVAGIKYDSYSDLDYSPNGSKIAHNTEGKIWITSLEGGKSQELQTGLPKDAKHTGFSWSPDGNKIVFSSMIDGEAEFWMISNFLPLEKLAQKNEKENEKKSEGIKIRQVWTGPGVDNSGKVSADGKYLSFTNWETGNLMIRNLKTGENRQLTNEATWDEPQQYAELSTISPDGKQVAYLWYNNRGDKGHYELRLIQVGSQSPDILYSLNKNEYMFPELWSSNNKKIIVQNYIGNTIWQLSSIDISTRKVLVLKEKTVPLWIPNLSLSPDDKYLAFDFPNPSDKGNYDIYLMSIDSKNELPIVEQSANDRLIGWLPGRNKLLFVSDRSGTRDLWAITVDNGKPSGPVKRIYADIGEAEPMGLTHSGDCYLGISRSNYNTYIVPFSIETGVVKEESGKSLTGSNTWVKWSPDGQYLTYIKENKKTNDPWQFTIQDLRTGEERKVANNLLTARSLCWSPEGNSILAVGHDKTKFSTKGYKGGIYKTDVRTGQTTEILNISDYKYSASEDEAYPLSDVEWSSDGKSIFYLFFTDRLVKRNLETSEETTLCKNSRFVRGILNRSPDGKNLLFGLFSPEEKKSRLFTIPVDGGKEKEVCTSQEAISFNSANWSPDGKYIYFLDSDGNNIWRVSAEGGKPQKVWYSKNKIRAFDICPDGTQIVLVKSEKITELRVIENLVNELEKADNQNEK